MVSADSDRLLAALDDEQRVAASTLLGPLCMLAGAGTGKTRAVTHRIAYGVATGVYSPGRVMALTFTARAAGELRSRLRSLGAGGVAARTFHAAALAQLGFFWPQVIGGTMPRILEAKGRTIAHAADSLGLKLDTPTLRDLAAEIEWRKISRLTLDQYARAARSRQLPESVGVDRMLDLQRAYESLKDERRQLDFEDVLLATAGMLESEPWVAQQVREQYRFFVIDEYQDVSPLQQALLELWTGDRQDVCVVGDASQTIYSFAGASSDYLLGFGARYPNAAVVRLERNYRSTPAIVDTANRLMRDRAGALVLRAAATPAAEPAPSVTAYPDDRAEARAVAERIAAQIATGTAPHDIAVLFRINVQGAVIEAALGDAGVPYQVRGGTRFFDLPEVKQALMMLKGAAVAGTVEPLFKTVSDVLRSLGWTQDRPEKHGAVHDRWESLNAIMAMAEEEPPTTTLRAFSEELYARSAGQHEPTKAAVTLATMHSAKGLEWESVHIIGASEGLMPISYAKSLEAIDEERRLIYVGITRARRELAISWSEQAPNRSARRTPSRFLEELRNRIPGVAPR